MSAVSFNSKRAATLSTPQDLLVSRCLSSFLTSFVLDVTWLVKIRYLDLAGQFVVDLEPQNSVNKKLSESGMN